MANQFLIKNTMQDYKAPLQSIQALSYWAITKKEIPRHQLFIISLKTILDQTMGVVLLQRAGLN